jgi:murein L,D-transpeptidase YafK
MLKLSCFLLSLIVCLQVQGQTFKASQQKCERVKTAYSEKWENLKADLTKQGINASNFELFIRVFKNEKAVEAWVRSKGQKEFKLFKTYTICASSGQLGPKRKQGDAQVPEGFYNVSAFNPYSSYYLSLGVSYPNQSDKIIGGGNLGGDIMIHGNCVTIGCMPLTDTYIKEVYILAVEARNGGQQIIPIHIFPTKLDDKEMKALTDAFPQNTVLLTFWKNLKTGYDFFEQHKQLPNVSVDKSGKYLFSEK